MKRRAAIAFARPRDFRGKGRDGYLADAENPADFEHKGVRATEFGPPDSPSMPVLRGYSNVAPRNEAVSDDGLTSLGREGESLHSWASPPEVILSHPNPS